MQQIGPGNRIDTEIVIGGYIFIYWSMHIVMRLDGGPRRLLSKVEIERTGGRLEKARTRSTAAHTKSNDR